ncbi:MAG: YggT family protein [Ilumatobacteraceae bacterium]|nr:YggT family protein [Ilumatobacteraceae bacterium]
MNLVCTAGNLYVFVIIARTILSWFPINPSSPLSQVARVIFSITEPVLGPARRVLPSMGQFDFSPLIVLIGLQVFMGAVLGC